ncbi:MAG: lantibiotic dehydratase [Saprospiraceae bacterium]
MDHNIRFPYIITRTAGLPFAQLEQWRFSGLQQESEWQDALRRSFDLVRQQANEATLQRALLFASHDLLNSILDLPDSVPPGGWNKKQRKTLFAALRYLSRAAAKTSPFSRLTTVSCQHIDAEDEPLPDFFDKNAVTPNVAFLPLLYKGLLCVPAFYQHLLVQRGAVETTATGFGWLTYYGGHESRQTAPLQPALELVLELLPNGAGPMPFMELLSGMVRDIDDAPENIETFLRQLLEAGFLQWVLPEQGLSASWAGQLYQKLGFFPADPAITAVAALLQHWRNVGRVLAYQPVQEAMNTQRELGDYVRSVLTDLGVDAGVVSPETVSYEDVDASQHAHVPMAALQALTEQLQRLWLAREAVWLPPDRARLLGVLTPGECLSLNAFYQRLQTNPPALPVSPQAIPPWTGSMGAILQPYWEDGRWKAVVNGLFPGGGKLMARWLHLFDSRVQEALVQWQDPEAFAFPWQGWSNANLQPALCRNQLIVPEGRTAHLPGGRIVRLEDLHVERQGNELLLCEQAGSAPIRFNDLGLEDVRSRPYMQRLLWRLGTPYVSVAACWPTGHSTINVGGWVLSPRVAQGDLVLRRASWVAAPAVRASWPLSTGYVFFRFLHKLAADLGLPTRLFCQFDREKPQYLDLDSPMLVEQYRRRLLQRPESAIVLTEMLPLPEQVNGGRAQEVVVEFRRGGV